MRLRRNGDSVLAAELGRKTARTSVDAKTHTTGDARHQSIGHALGGNQLQPTPLKAGIRPLSGHIRLGKPVG
jgi:hypothetical protein